MGGLVTQDLVEATPDAHVDILSLGSLHDAVFTFSQQTSLDAFWKSVAANLRWVVPARSVHVLKPGANGTCSVVSRVIRGQVYGPEDVSLGECLVTRLTSSRPEWVEDISTELGAGCPSSWLDASDMSSFHTVPLLVAFERPWILLIGLSIPEDVNERARITALTSLYARHAASAYTVIRTATDLEQRNQTLGRTQQQLIAAADEIRDLNATLEQRIEERTRELQDTHNRLVTASKKVGMAEVASGVLHNVGNALSSVNVAAHNVEAGFQRSATARLGRVTALLEDHADDLAGFLTSDHRGKNLVHYLSQLDDRLEEERQFALAEIATIRDGVSHIKSIVRAQQAHSGTIGMIETCSPAGLLSDALQLVRDRLNAEQVEVVEILEETPDIETDAHMIVQILVNLVSNAVDAMRGSLSSPRVSLRLSSDEGTISYGVEDNGVGIHPDAASKIFTFGFTTKSDGHGFGLHHSALAAQQLGGSLGCRSEGPGLGATFVLTLPVDAESAKGEQ